MSDVPLNFKIIDECRMTPAFIGTAFCTVKVVPKCSLGPSYHLRVTSVDFHNNHNEFSFSM